MPDPNDDTAASADRLTAAADQLSSRMHELEVGAGSFSRAMTSAFAGAVSHGRQLDDVLKSLALRLSDLALKAAMKPIAGGLASGLGGLLSGLFGGGASASAAGSTQATTGTARPFAIGGMIGAPPFFPLASGGIGAAGEAGPEAIMPLARGPDGRLGVAASASGSPASVTIQIVTPDAESFRRSEVYLAGQIARAVARGQRGL